MITKYKEPKRIAVKNYVDNDENSGKVAVFDMTIPGIVAEGEGTDWYELELMYENLRESGDYELVIVHRYQPTVTRFESVNA